MRLTVEQFEAMRKDAGAISREDVDRAINDLSQALRCRDWNTVKYILKEQLDQVRTVKAIQDKACVVRKIPNYPNSNDAVLIVYAKGHLSEWDNYILNSLESHPVSEKELADMIDMEPGVHGC